MTLPVEVEEQIRALSLTPGRPLIISDADEVLVQFAAGLDIFLRERDLYFDIASFAITGNVRRLSDDEAIDAAEVQSLLQIFFRERTEHLPAVPGAAEALEKLSTRAHVVVLTNIPAEQRDARIRGLAKHGINYPVIANSGLKGFAVRRLADLVGDAPVLFLDDIPHNITSVAEEASDVHRIHFVADPRLAKLLKPAEHCHHRIDDWDSAHDYIDAHLGSFGH